MTRPFALVPAQANPWAGEVVDLESLHADATDAIVGAVHHLCELGRSDARDAARPAPLSVLGTAGIGKTHLFARLRRKLGPRAVLVLVRPLVGSEITPRFLLGQVLEQLGRESYGVRQIDALAAAILAVAVGENPQFPRGYLDFLHSLPEAQRATLVEDVIETLIERQPDLDEPYLRRLLGVPFMKPLARAAALAWLGGRELDEPQAARIGVRDALSDDSVARGLRTLAVAAAPAAPLLVVFDQLENLVDAEGHRVRAYGNLVAELVDVVRDVVIVQMALDSEWQSGILPALSLSQRERIASRRILLGLPRPADLRALLDLWIRELPDRPAPFPWPFSEAALERVCAAPGMTPRRLLLELERSLEGGAHEDESVASTPATTPEDQASAEADVLAAEWEQALGQARADVDAMAELDQGPEPALLVDGLASLVSLLDGVRIAKSSGPDLVVLERGKARVSLVLVHHPAPRSVASACKRIAGLQGAVLAMREAWRELRPTWAATKAEWNKAVARPDVAWHWLGRDDAIRLLALGSLVKDATSQDVSGPDAKPIGPARVAAWVKQALRPSEWEVAIALLGKASAEPLADGPPASPVKPARATSSAGPLRLLDTLGVASLDRLLRELAREGAPTTRAELIASLRAAGDGVRFYGDGVVFSTRRAAR